MTKTRPPRRFFALPALVAILASCSSLDVARAPITRNPRLESLEKAVEWERPSPLTVLSLAGELIATRRDHEGFEYFQERAKARPDQPVFLALEGLFQARLSDRVSLLRRISWVKEAIAKLDRAASRDDGLSRYFRGVVFSQLPARFGRAETAVADLSWALQDQDWFPLASELRRSIYHSLAAAYTTLGQDSAAQDARRRSGSESLDGEGEFFVWDSWVTAKDGFRFGSPRVVERAPGVYVAHGYDFADLAFVLTHDGIVAIDAGTTPETARAALAALRRISKLPITHVILTHAHWDHVGGLNAIKERGTTVIAQSRFADELSLVNERRAGFRYFFGANAPQRFDVVPDHLVSEREDLTVGGVTFVLYPIRGGETSDALLVHMPALGVVFVGDAFMPYLGAPFLPEGSAEGLFETMTLVQALRPSLLVHGHPPLTELWTADALPGLEPALRELYERTITAIGDGIPLADALQQSDLPESLRDHAAAIMPYLVMRENFVKRIYHQRTGYWKADGEGLEAFTAKEWTAALDLLAGGKDDAFIETVRALLERSDHALALKIADLGLIKYPTSRRLSELRLDALERLRQQDQQLNPFKFILYSEWANAELPPVK